MTVAPPRMTARDSGTENGLAWATCNAPRYGAVNGYVRIPEDHPLHDLDYDAVMERLDLSDLLGGAGELTYARDGWIGFDTLHICDAWPEAPDRWEHEDSVHWTPELVANQTRALARKVAAAAR